METASVNIASVNSYGTDTFDLQKRGFYQNPRLRRFGDITSHTATVTGLGDDTGGYQLRVTQVDLAAGDKSTEFEVKDNGTGHFLIKNAIDTVGDVDFHKFTLPANSWHRFSYQEDIDTIRIHTPDDTVTMLQGEPYRASSHSFFAKEAGKYFVEVRAEDLSFNQKLARWETVQVLMNFGSKACLI